MILASSQEKEITEKGNILLFANQLLTITSHSHYTMSSKYVSLAIGAHTWTPDNITEVEGLVQVMRKHGIKIIDTARSYVCE